MPVDTLTEPRMEGGRRLKPRLDETADPWRTLRAAWDEMQLGEELAVGFDRSGGIRLGRQDVVGLLRLAGFEPHKGTKTAITQEVVARKRERNAQPLTCSVVVPCRNEADNILQLVQRLPLLGTQTELIFVDGASTDGTVDRIEDVMRNSPQRDIRLLRQVHGGGKAAASFQGLAAAHGDVVIILDADMTVPPEELPRFYLALAEDVGDVANGTRSLYPMEKGAMPTANRAGNRFFSAYMSWLVGTRLTDTLCGSKAFRRRDIPAILGVRPRFGGHDRWGDFDMLMAAAYLGLRIVDVPVSYASRVAGESKMRPWRDGLELARSCLVGTRILKLGGASGRP